MQKIAASFLLAAMLLTGMPVSAQTAGSLTPAQQEKVTQIEEALAAEQNHPFNRLWQLIAHTSLTGMLIDRVWTMFQNYRAQREYNRATDLKQDRVNNTIKESGVRSGVDTKNGRTPADTVPTRTTPTKPTPTPGSSVSVPTKGTGSSVGGSGGGSVAPSASTPGKKEAEEDETVKQKTGSAAITAIEGDVSPFSWLQELLGW